jgi:hypothetical protein
MAVRVLPRRPQLPAPARASLTVGVLFAVVAASGVVRRSAGRASTRATSQEDETLNTPKVDENEQRWQRRAVMDHPAVAANRRVSWSTLSPKARMWRAIHAGWSVVGLSSLGYIWASALTGRRDWPLWASVGFLLVEGGALVVGRGDCPMGQLQAEWGDPVPFFELVLPPRLAKAAVPALAVATLAGIAAIALLPPGLVRRHP